MYLGVYAIDHDGIVMVEHFEVTVKVFIVDVIVSSLMIADHDIVDVILLRECGKIFFRLLVEQGERVLAIRIIYPVIIKIGARSADDISAGQRRDTVVVVVVCEECRVRCGVLLDVFGGG